MRVNAINGIVGYTPRVTLNGYAELLRLERMEAREKEHQKKVRQMYRDKTNAMAMDMSEISPFYTQNGNAGHYEFVTFEKYA